MSEILGNYPFEFVESDTYSGFAVRLTIKDTVESVLEPVDLTGSVVQMRIQSTDKSRRKSIDLTTYNGRIKITDATDGKFMVVKQKIKLPAGLYDYSLQVKFPNGDQKTYLVGNCKVISNSTSKSY
tara:strand:- start:22061 stop:22438 length:378 start_codon:yes stop_codon:yes gene_type:complete